MDVELYNGEKHIVTLHSFYHKKEIIEECLKKVGFKQVIWEKAIISPEGISKLGNDFWEGYLENIDIAYFVAVK